MATEVKVTWIGPELRLLGRTEEGQSVVVDHVLPHEDRPETGITPMRLMLISLGGCSMMDVVSIMGKKRQNFSKIHVNISGERADEHPKVYTKIHMEYVVTGKDIDPQAVERSIELSHDKYCSASAMLSKTAEITTSYRIVDEEEEE